MRIISKFKDYYDTCMYYGMDKELVYSRQSQNIQANITQLIKENTTIGHFNYSAHHRYISNKENIEFNFGSIGFCGKFYPYIKFARRMPFDRLTQMSIPDEVTFCYSAEQTHEFMQKFPYTGKNNLDRGGNPIKNYPLTVRMPYQHYTEKYMSLESYYTNNFKESLEPFYKYNTPIIVESKSTPHNDPMIEVNACLKNYQFYRMFDAFKAFQEISMFVGGVLPQNGKEMIVLSDVMKRDKHGFDDMSFKTYSPGKKANRKNK